MNSEQKQSLGRYAAPDALEADIALLEELLSQALAIARREATATESAPARPH